MGYRIFIVCSALLWSLTGLSQTNDRPAPYLQEFTQKVLAPYFSPIQEHVKLDIETLENGEKSLRMRVQTPAADKAPSITFSEYRFIFFPSDSPLEAIPEVDIHRWRDRDGKFLHPNITGEMRVPYNDQKLVDLDSLHNQVRSLFRSDFTLHPLHPNPFLSARDKQLTPPQKEILLGKKSGGFEQPGLIKLYTDHLQSEVKEPAWLAAIMPTGLGKTFIALKFWQTIRMQSPDAKLVFIVENSAILRDVIPKVQEIAPGAKTLRLFGAGSTSVIDGPFDVILATRSTYFKRMTEIHEILEKAGQPVTMVRDEAHHTGKQAGQLEAIAKDFMARMGKTSQILDITATMWHHELTDMVRRYSGKVATAFLEPEEYRQLIRGIRVDTLARIQLIRAFFSGWLAPLESMTFITQIENVEDEGKEIRSRLLGEQKSLVERFGLKSDGALEFHIGDISGEQLSALRTEIERVHGPIVEVILKDLKSQFSRDASGRVAQYDRGLIFVPTIIHAEIYVRLLEMATQNENMEFRMVHSKMPRTARQDPVTENFDWLNDGEKPQHRHKYLINVGMAREGVDIPTLNRIVFATVSDNIKVLLQVLGRGLRLAPGKSGVRLTDLTGSYEMFFRGLPEKLLARFFPGENGRGHSDWNWKNPFVRDGRSMGWIDFLRLRVAELTDTIADVQKGDAKQTTLTPEEQAEKEAAEKRAEMRAEDRREQQKLLEQKRAQTFEALDTIEERFGWSRATADVSQDQVNRAVHHLLLLTAGADGWDIDSEARHFLRIHWRQLTMTWADFLTDQLLSKESLYGERAYIKNILKVSQKNIGKAQSLERQKYNHVHQSLFNADLEVLPETFYRFGLKIKGEASRQFLASYLLVQTLTATEHGRQMLAKAPGISQALASMDAFFQMNQKATFNKIVDPARGQNKEAWELDYRWSLRNPVSGALIDQLSTSGEYAELRALGIQQGLPSDINGQSRDGGSGLRLSQLAYEGRGSLIYSHHYGQFLAGPHITSGLPKMEATSFNFSFVHYESPKNGGWSSIAQSRYVQHFYAQEDTMWRQALIVEIAKSQGVEAVQILDAAKGLHPLTEQVIQKGQTVGLTLEDMLSDPDLDLLKGDKADIDARLNYIMRHEASYFNLSSQSVPESDARLHIWESYLYRLTNHEALQSPIVNDPRFAEVVEALHQGLAPVKQQSLAGFENVDWLLEPLPKQIFVGTNWLAIYGSHFNRNLFEGPRVIHLLRFYLAAQTGFGLQNFPGIGEVTEINVKKAISWFEKAYAEPLSRIVIPTDFRAADLSGHSKVRVKDAWGDQAFKADAFWSAIYLKTFHRHLEMLAEDLRAFQEESKGGRKKFQRPTRTHLDPVKEALSDPSSSAAGFKALSCKQLFAK